MAFTDGWWLKCWPFHGQWVISFRCCHQNFFTVNFFYDFRLKCLFLRLMANFLVFDSFNGYRLTSLRLCQCNSKIFLTNTYGDVQQLTGRKITDQILGDFGVLISIQERTWTFVDSNDFSKWIFLFFFHHLSA